MSEDTRTVVVTKASADDKDYLGAVVHPDKESAESALAENKRNTPWFNHSVVAMADFDKEAETAATPDNGNTPADAPESAPSDPATASVPATTEGN